MSVGHLRAVIWTRWILFCGEPLRISITLTIQTIEALKHEIEAAIYEIDAQAIENWFVCSIDFGIRNPFYTNI